MPFIYILLQATQSVPPSTWDNLRNASALIVISGSVIGLISMLIRSQTRSIETREQNLSNYYVKFLETAQKTNENINAHTKVLVELSENMANLHENITKQRLLMATQEAELEERLTDRIEKRIRRGSNDKS